MNKQECYTEDEENFCSKWLEGEWIPDPKTPPNCEPGMLVYVPYRNKQVSRA